jgi:CubicO group peptidase (beta-lactamase class C family)
MSRVYILITFLIMFLSCGNTAPVTYFTGKSGLEIITTLTNEQKIISQKLDDLFSGLNRSGHFNGSILVAKAGKILYQRSIGLLDKKTREKLTDSSMFQLASVSKVITATAVLMLHERELLDINLPFKAYFPDFPYNDVTIKQLLNHRSGLPNYIYILNKEICQPDYRMNNEEMYNYFVAKNSKPYLKPDCRFNYCNTNYALLGLLIEKVSGTSYSSFLKEELFKPLGMLHTSTILDIDLNGPNTTRPYDERWRPIEFDASDYVLGDKSIYSTPYDLYLFSEAMYNNRIIKPQTQELAYTAFSREQKNSNYGYGWRMVNYNDPVKKEVYHNGWWHGYRSSFHRRLNDTLTVVILSNQLNRAAYQTQKVYQILDSSASLIVDDEETN